MMQNKTTLNSQLLDVDLFLRSFEISAVCRMSLSEAIQNKQWQGSDGGLKGGAVYEFQFVNKS